MTNSDAQRASPSYRLPVEDTDFLLRDEMRGHLAGVPKGCGGSQLERE